MDTRFLENFLLRCLIYGFALLILSFLIFLLLGDWAYSVHSSIFELNRHEFDLMFYYVLAFLKMFVLMVFVIPYLALRFTPKNQKS